MKLIGYGVIDGQLECLAEFDALLNAYNNAKADILFEMCY